MNGASSNNFPYQPPSQQPPAGPPYPYGPQAAGQPHPSGPAPHQDRLPAVRGGRDIEPVPPPRPASIVRPALDQAVGAVRRVKPSAWVELGIALPWLWWSWLAITWFGRPSPTVFWILITAWIGSAIAVAVYPGAEQLLATKIYRLRKPSNQELQRLREPWLALCARTGTDPNAYRLSIHEGPEATAPNAVAGSSIAVTSWAIHTLPPAHLEAVLAHELAHHLAIGRVPSLLLYWLTLPARIAGHIVDFCWRTRFLKFVLLVLVGVIVIGIVGVLYYLGADSWWPWALLSPFLAPVIVPWTTRIREKLTDRAALQLGYGVLLAQVFTGREHERNAQMGPALRQHLKGTQPLDSARLEALENLLPAPPYRQQ